MKTRIVARTKYPSFRQLCAIVRQVITEHPDECEADLKERIKVQHLRLGYLYSNDQIPRAMDAVEQAMGRYFLTDEQVTALRQSTPANEMALQVDPPWRASDRGPSQWTSISDLARHLSNRSGTRSRTP